MAREGWWHSGQAASDCIGVTSRSRVWSDTLTVSKRKLGNQGRSRLVNIGIQLAVEHQKAKKRPTIVPRRRRSCFTKSAGDPFLEYHSLYLWRGEYLTRQE